MHTHSPTSAPACHPRSVRYVAVGIEALVLLAVWLAVSYWTTGYWFAHERLPFRLDLWQSLAAAALVLLGPRWLAAQWRTFLRRPRWIVLGLVICAEIYWSFTAELLVPLLSALGIGLAWHAADIPSRTRFRLAHYPRLCSAILLGFVVLLVIEVGLQAAALTVFWWRGRAIAVQPGSEFTILCVGDSFTAGVGASDRAHTWPALLEEKLRARWPGRSLSVINAGMAGKNSSTLRTLLPELLARTRPQVVLVSCGENNRWSFDAVDPRRYQNVAKMDRRSQWLRQCAAAAQSLRLVRLARLSGFRFHTRPPQPALLSTDEMRELGLYRLGLVRNAQSWLGDPLRAVLVGHLKRHESLLVQRAWALGRLLAGEPTLDSASQEVQASAQVAFHALSRGQADMATTALWEGRTLTPAPERSLIEALALLHSGRQAEGVARIERLWRDLGNDPIVGLLVLDASPAGVLALEVQQRNAAFGPAPAVAFLHYLSLAVSLPGIESRMKELDPIGHHALYKAFLALEPQGPAAVLAHLEHCVTVDPDWPWAWQQIGMHRALLFDHDAALAACDRALALCPGDATALRWKAFSLIHQKRFAEAIETLDAALAAGLSPNDYRPLAVGAFEGDPSAVERHIEAMRMRNPTVFEALPRIADAFHADAVYLRILEEDLDAMRALCEQYGARFLVHTYPYESEVSRFLEEYGTRRGVLAVTHRPAFQTLLKTMRYEDVFLPDGHCRDIGYALMAQNLADALIASGSEAQTARVFGK